MRIELNERNYEASEHLKRIIDQKLSKLDKYFDEEAVAKVVLKKEGSSNKTEVMLSYAGKFIRAEVSSDNFYENIDKVLPKLEGQIRKYRTQFDKHNKNNAYFEQALYAINDIPEKKGSQIVKEKKFKISPLTDEEAVEKMDMLGHNFFVYKDLKTNAVKVVYVRNDGDYGVISTEE